VDGARRLAFLAAGSGGLLVVDVTDPGAPALRGALPLAGADAVAVIADSLVVVARRGGAASGVTFVDVTDPAAPVARGSLNAPLVQDPRALAVRDTVVFVADQLLGLMSVGFRDPDAPAQIGPASGIPARDVDLSGTSLLVGTVADGVQVVDVTTPESPALLATLPAPPIYGVAQQGATGLALLGDGGALAIDLTVPAAPRVRGVIQIPGFSRDAVWVGDTLLVAASFALERFYASPVVTADPALWFVLDSGSILPRLLVSWTVPVPPGAIGWNLHRDTGAATDGLSDAVGVRVNDSLLPTAVSAALDATVQAGTTYRYRLEAFFPDGSSRKAADGVIRIGSNSGLGRAYPNPYRPRNGQVLRIPYRVLSIDGGKSIELSVHDPSGRLVRRIRGTTAPGGGFGSMTWDGRDERGRVLADGVYFVKLTGPGIDDARQIILLR
jgi:flagellar hook capping protein FlgD/LVIVD repeat-containing protein